MPRPRLDMTPEEKREYQLEKMRNYYSEHSDKIKKNISERTTEKRIERRKELGMDLPPPGEKLKPGRIRNKYKQNQKTQQTQQTTDSEDEKAIVFASL